MTDSELPEDTTQWPSDPYSLLGVNRSDDAKTIKRAYNARIRRFKPEHFPEQFRKLREAYESLRDGSFFFQHPYEPKTQGPIDEFSSVGRSIDPNQEAYESAWNWIEQGRFQDGIEQIHARPDKLQNVHVWSLLEYWFTKHVNDQTEQSEVTMFLLKNLRSFEFTGPFLSLLRAELFQNPDLAESICIGDFIQHEAIPKVLDLIRLRWEAAHRIQNFELIRNDHELLMRHFFGVSRLQDWFSVRAVNHLLWSNASVDHQFVSKVVADLESLGSIHSEMTFYLDQMDQAKEIRSSLQRSEIHLQEKNSLLTAIGWMWNDMDLDYMKLTMEWLIAAHRSPKTSLPFFDFLHGESAIGQFLFDRFDYVLNHYAFGEDHERAYELSSLDDDEQDKPPSTYESTLIEDFLSTYQTMLYVKYRKLLIDFCVTKHVSVQKIINYVRHSNSTYAKLFRDILATKISDDRSLQKMQMVLFQVSVALDSAVYI